MHNLNLFVSESMLLLTANHENQISEAESLTPRDLAFDISFSDETRFIVQLVKI